MKKNAVFLTLLPVLAVMLAIFLFSAQNAEDSSGTSGSIVKWVLSIVVPGLEQMDAARQQAIRDTAEFIIRKLAHFTEFAALGFFLMLHLNELAKRVRLQRLWLWSWGLSTFYAATDEFHQFFVGGRAPDIRDVCIDSTGAMAGTLAMLLILHLCAGKRRR